MPLEKTSDIINVLRFFDRPTQPCFMPKGVYRNVFLDVPESYYPERFQNTMNSIKNQKNNLKDGTIIEIEELPYELDLSQAQKLDSTTSFTLFNPFHISCASQIINILLETKSEYLLSACSKIQLAGVNPYMFEYALSVALIHREDTRKFPLPSPITHLPEFYLTHEVITKAQREGSAALTSEDRNYIDILPTATNVDVENRVAYFREDIGINIHHWHWHIVYPFNISGPNGASLVDKDRRGELFYYMHQQILARYNTERLCNKLNRAVGFNYLRDPILEAYFPKLSAPYTKYNWASRHVNALVKDVNRDPFYTTILDMELWRDRILNAIHLGRVYKKEELVPLDDETGIDVLGNMVEASMLSPNQNYYGNFHNMGHILFAYCHDPDNRYLENLGVMGDNRTAMRDPIFYRWHAFIDDIFQTHKKTLPSYTVDQLKFDDVKITSFKVTTPIDPNLEITNTLENVLVTYTQLDQVNLSHGIDVQQSGGPIYVKFPHLQHKEFTYEINVNNPGSEKIGTVRIFLAPAINETLDLFLLKDQRRFFIELDKFKYTLNAKKITTILWSSKNSSVTIPFKQMFLDIEDILNEADSYKQSLIANCGCGWPEYMLIPRGSESGYPFLLFVMISNHEQDKVDVTTDGIETECTKCPLVSAPSYCGLQNQKYPDKRSMGYPFDRPLRDEARTIDEFLTPNMMVANIKIVFKNKTLDGETIDNDK